MSEVSPANPIDIFCQAKLHLNEKFDLFIAQELVRPIYKE